MEDDFYLGQWNILAWKQNLNGWTVPLYVKDLNFFLIQAFMMKVDWRFVVEDDILIFGLNLVSIDIYPRTFNITCKK